MPVRLSHKHDVLSAGHAGLYLHGPVCGFRCLSWSVADRCRSGALLQLFFGACEKMSLRGSQACTLRLHVTKACKQLKSGDWQPAVQTPISGCAHAIVRCSHSICFELQLAGAR